LTGVRVFEVDHPTTAAMKRDRLEAMFGSIPSRVTYVQVDFETEDWAGRLTDAGYDGSKPTLFVWCGVSMYIPKEAVAGVLRFVGSSSSPGTSIVFDHISREMAEGTADSAESLKGGRMVSRIGEPYRFGVSQGDTAEFVARFGLRLESDLGTRELARRYVIDRNGRPPFRSRPREGGVAIAHARTEIKRAGTANPGRSRGS
jgi:methyltransferase (TIGR00027 family)